MPVRSGLATQAGTGTGKKKSLPVSTLGFTVTIEQQDQEDEEHRKSTEIIICVKCRDLYIENKNKMGTCKCHDRFVYDNSALDFKKYKPSDAMKELNREEFIELKDPKQKDDIDQ